jgi:rhodanese-related sulfurtransferase
VIYQKQGFLNAKALKGGLRAWKNLGYPLKNGDGSQ